MSSEIASYLRGSVIDVLFLPNIELKPKYFPKSTKS